MFVCGELVVTMCFGLCCWFWACYVRSSLLAVDTCLMRFSALHLYIRWAFRRTAVLHSAFLVYPFFGIVNLLELLFGRQTYVFAQSCNAVGVVL